MSSIGSPADIESAKGKLGILMPGLGAVSTTFIAGTLAIRKGISSPIGSLTQMGSLRLGKRTDNNEVEIKNFVPLSSLDDLVFGGWDIFEDNCYEAAINAGVIDTKLLDQVKDELSSIVILSSSVISCDPIVNTKLPVAGSYVAAVGVYG